MGIRLIYHTTESASGGISPFDQAIKEMAKDSKVFIACPYLNLRHLQDVITLAESWQLLTDVEEWILSHSEKDRHGIREFVQCFPGQVHHLKDLHAKVIIAGDKAILGSANFTQRGLTQRTEMSVHFEQEPQVEELHDWFSDVWNKTGPVNPDELDRCIQFMPSNSSEERKHSVKLTCMAPLIHSKLVPQPKISSVINVAEGDPNIRAWFVNRLARTSNRVWVEDYFDLLRVLIEEIGIDNDDPRLVTSIPRSGHWLFPVSINNRYVLAPRYWKNNLQVSIILGSEFERRDDLKAIAAYYVRFDPLYKERSFDTPFLVSFNSAREILASKELRCGWLDAAAYEMNRASSSSYRKYHQPLAYRAAVDPDTRAELLNEAFGNVR